MTIDFNRLKELPVAELRTLAIQQGLTPHHRCKAEALVKMIIEHATTPVKQELKHPAELPQPAPLRINTEAEVREVCKMFFEKPGFEAKFNPDNTWHFKCRGSEDSGHMSVPIRVMRWKAESVSRGARRMVTIKNADGHDVMMAGA